MQIPVVDGSSATPVLERIEITGRAWYRDALEWLAKGPTDRNTVSGAIWMGMMAMLGLSRGASAVRAAKGVAPSAYSVAARVEIKALGEGTRKAHFKQANGILKEAMETDPQLAKMMDSLSVRIPADMTKSPLNWTWHHVPNMPGTLELVPLVQHAPGSLFQPLFHFLPGNAGGFAQWGARF